MSERRAWLVWLVIAGVFIAGAVTGGLVSLRVAKAVVDHGRGADQFTPRQMERLTKELGLTEAQQALLRPILDRTWKSLRQHRKDSFEAMHSLEAEVMAILTDDQRTEYTSIQQAQKKRWKRMMERRESRKGEKGERKRPPEGEIRIRP
ncbi:MAG: hypothetical protein J6386_16520 [Candidatus Synoicihabitans palmerolidicus]|nr:hypothetical protein [Candidatus Synoicihabitans palmerolidicus]